MFVYQSNRLEHLLTAFCEQIQEAPLDPFTAELVVVQNMGMAKWFTQQVARQTGIAAHIDYLLPAAFLWQQVHTCLPGIPKNNAFDRNLLIWRIFRLLPDFSLQEECAELRHYLHDDEDQQKRLQLAEKISDIFDQYLIYRPDLLLSWEANEDHSLHWQASLWRILSQETPMHRARLFSRFLQETNTRSAPGLASRISLFAISTLEPSAMDIVQHLARFTKIHLYHLSPCREFWGDIVSAKQRAAARKYQRNLNQKRGEQGEIAEARDDEELYFSAGNPLLASLGKIGRDFFNRLVHIPEQIELHEAPGTDTTLHCLQDDILNLRNRSKRTGKDGDTNSDSLFAFASTTWTEDVPEEIALPDTHSLHFHACHSTVREVQVLHDQILALFDSDHAMADQLQGLQAADILVMAPDISLYTPAIQGIFGMENTHHLPWSLADQTQAEQSPILGGFLALLDILKGRCTAPDVLGLLENPAVQEQFSLPASELPTLMRWVEESGIRWGLNQEHRQGLTPSDHSDQQASAWPEFTWQFGLDRLLLGYLMGEDLPLFQGQAPLAESVGLAGATQESINLLGGLCEYHQAIREASSLFFSDQGTGTAPRKPLYEWCQDLRLIQERFFAPSVDEEGRALLLEALIELEDLGKRADLEDAVPFAVIHHYLHDALTRPARQQAFAHGQITFCNMVPLRTIPFRVICLLGMNDQSFPRLSVQPAFNLICQDPREGDREKRHEDRYLFLEALISARDMLYISWVGRNQRDNTVQPPSVVIGEVLDYLDRSFPAEPLPSTALVTEHPLQPFHPACFQPGSPVQTYAQTWKPADTQQDCPAFSAQALPEAEKVTTISGEKKHAEASAASKEVRLTSLLQFWKHPVRYFLQHRLGMSLAENGSLLPDTEPFRPNQLDTYTLRQDLTTHVMAGLDSNEVYAHIQAQAVLPVAEFGRRHFHHEHASSMRLAERMQRFQEKYQLRPLSPCSFRLNLAAGPWLLYGSINDLFLAQDNESATLIRLSWTPHEKSIMKKGKHIFTLWIQHLILQILLAQGDIEEQVQKEMPGIPSRQGKQGKVKTVQSHHFTVEESFFFSPAEQAEEHLHQIMTSYFQGHCEPVHFFPDTSLAWAEANHKGKKPPLLAARKKWAYGPYNERAEERDPANVQVFAGTDPLNTDFCELATLFSPALEHCRKHSEYY